MTLKVNWKTTNRGLWLAAIAIIIVVINIIIDDVQFKNEKDEIAKTVYDFADEMENLLPSPKEIVSGEEEWSDEKVKTHKEEILDGYNRYWTKTEVNSYLEPFAGIGQYSDEIEQMFKEMKANKGYIKSIEFELGTLTIKQYGPDGAVVTGDMNVDITYRNIDTIVYGLGSFSEYMYEDMDYVSEKDAYIDGVLYEDGYSDEYENEDSKEEDEQGKYEEKDGEKGYSSEITVVLFRENGEWKISGISAF